MTGCIEKQDVLNDFSVSVIIHRPKAPGEGALLFGLQVTFHHPVKPSQDPEIRS